MTDKWIIIETQVREYVVEAENLDKAYELVENNSEQYLIDEAFDWDSSEYYEEYDN